MAQTAEVGIVGAGPIGIELAVALRRAGIQYVHWEAGQIAQTISWFAPATHFFSSAARIAIAGVPLETPWQDKPTREDYLAYLRCVVQQFDLPVHTYHPVRDIRRVGTDFMITAAPSTGDKTWRVKRLILATGGTATPRLLGVPGEGLPHVAHYFTDPHAYFRRRLLIVGGANSAVEAALRCHRTGSRVSFVHRGDGLDAKSIKYWLYPEMKSLLDSGQITGYFNTQVEAIAPGEARLLGADGQIRDVPADFVLLMIGYAADMRLCAMAGVTLSAPNNAPVFDPSTMETNVPGVYVAGTAIAGNQDRYHIFIENCHDHAERIVASILGRKPPAEHAPAYDRPES